MVERKEYEALIRECMFNRKIKVFTGMYRSGKSSMLRTVEKILRKRGVPIGEIVYIDFDAVRHSNIHDGSMLMDIIKSLSKEKSRLYLLLDEIGFLPGWQDALAELMSKPYYDIYITGTRGMLFSKEKTVLPEDLYMEIPVYPFRFSEFLNAKGLEESSEKYCRYRKEMGDCKAEAEQRKLKSEASEEMLQKSSELEEAARSEWEILCEQLHQFMIYGNLPGIHRVEQSQEAVFSYLLDVFQAGILQNVVRRYKIRNVDQVWMVLHCIGENLGHPLSAKVIAQKLKAEGQAVGKDTVYTLLDALLESQVLQKTARYELKSGKELEAQEKYFFTDWGMYHSLIGMTRGRQKPLIENMVCMEMISSGWHVNRLCIPDYDALFIARKEEKIEIFLLHQKFTDQTKKKLKKQLQKAFSCEENMISFSEIDEENLLEFLL